MNDGLICKSFGMNYVNGSAGLKSLKIVLQWMYRKSLKSRSVLRKGNLDTGTLCQGKEVEVKEEYESEKKDKEI